MCVRARATIRRRDKRQEMVRGCKQLVFLTVALIACCLLPGAFPVSAQQKSKSKITVLRVYDPAINETVTRISPDLSETFKEFGKAVIFPGSTPGNQSVGSQMTAYYIFTGKTASRPESVRLMFTAYGTTKYKTKNDFTIKADGELVLQGKAEYRQRQLVADKTPDKDTKYEEALTLVVPLDIFLSLSKAKKVHLKIGPSDFDLNEKQRQSLATLAASIDKCESPDCLWGTLDKR